MPFNLVTTAWLPILRASGQAGWMCPADLTDGFDQDPVVALDFPRADWNGAVSEWLIGLTWLAFQPDTPPAWAERYRQPPSVAALDAAFARFAFAFDLDGTGPRAFQDQDSLSAVDSKPLAGLLIDAPGENAVRNNTDLFVKRGGAAKLSLPYAAAALITLQTYAPAGGVGHRTSLRGGGPLTTLVAPWRRLDGRDVCTLWDRIWANLPDPVEPDADPAKVFPWLAQTRLSDKGQVVAPEDVPPAQAFFACPRRIRLDFGEGDCALGGPDGPVVVGYRTINYGANYKGWEHPLSPYYHDKKAGKLPVHPHGGSSHYGDWIAWWGLDGEPAAPLRLWQERRLEIANIRRREGIEAFGFDMDNAKARQWVQHRLPWVPLYGREAKVMEAAIKQAATAAKEAAGAVRFAVKLALFGQRKDQQYRLPETLPMDSGQEPAERLWRETEGAFATLVDALSKLLNDGPQATTELDRQWLATLAGKAHAIFNETVDLDGLTNQDPHRLLYAAEQLNRALSSFGPVAKALRLTTTTKKPVKEPA
jgi:CRISPR system Cascade subunit CasA